MHISHTWLNSQENNSKNHPDSSILHSSHRRPNIQYFFLPHPIYNLNDLYDLCYSMSPHTQSPFIYQSNYCQKWIKVTLCQTDLILTLNCIIISTWVPNLIWEAYYKLPKICLFKTFYKPNEKISQFWCFTLTSPFYNIFTNCLSIWEVFD